MGGNVHECDVLVIDLDPALPAEDAACRAGWIAFDEYFKGAYA